MKNKLRFWLNIVTICLCVCAIAIGVYSATTAKITAGGKIAFSAHNCKVEVTGYIYGHGVKDGIDHADGLPVAPEDAEYLTDNNAPITIEGGVNTTTESTISIGERWFTDMESTDGKPANIVIGITVKNITIYDITVTTTLDKQSVTLPDEQVTISCPTTSAELSKDETITFVYTLELTPLSSGSTSAVYEGFDLNNLVIPLNAQKLVTVADGEYYINEDGLLMVNMGHAPADDIPVGYEKEKIEWFAFAVKGPTRPSFVASNAASITVTPTSSTSETWYSMANSTVTLESAKGHTFWFIQKYVTLGSHYDNEGTWIEGGVQFHSTTTQGTTYCLVDYKVPIVPNIPRIPSPL